MATKTKTKWIATNPFNLDGKDYQKDEEVTIPPGWSEIENYNIRVNGVPFQEPYIVKGVRSMDKNGKMVLKDEEMFRTVILPVLPA